MGTQINKGLQVFGHGSVQATNLAAGEKASVVIGSVGSDKDREELLSEIMLKLDELQSHIQNQPTLPGRELVADSAATLKEELSKPKPNKLTVTAVLDGIGAAVKSVTTIAGCVEGLKAIISRLL